MARSVAWIETSIPKVMLRLQPDDFPRLVIAAGADCLPLEYDLSISATPATACFPGSFWVFGQEVDAIDVRMCMSSAKTNPRLRAGGSFSHISADVWPHKM